MAGKRWRLFASQVLELSSTVMLGLAVTSHTKNETAVASFKDITLL
ncbi:MULTISPECIES: hypothetical protein [unclassified Paenibacillus]